MGLKTWPKEVIGLYLGTVDKAGVLSAAEGSGVKDVSELKCEAFFYLGQEALARGSLQEAGALFRQALDTRVSYFIEYTGSELELRRLNP